MQWSRIPTWALALASVLAGLSCVLVEDPEYCENDDVCERRGGPRMVCDAIDHFCVQVREGGCTRDAHCTSPTASVCDRRQNLCVPCRVEANSPTDGQNAGCSHLQGPRRPYCVKQGGGTACVECLASPDCSRERPYCEASACRPCREHRECGPDVVAHDGKPAKGSWVCIGPDDGEDLRPFAGQCASNAPNGGLVVYANNSPIAGMCNDDPGNPGYTLPKCSLDAAIQSALGSRSRPYVRLLGADFQAAGAIDSRNARLIIIGAETRDLPRATVRDSNNILFQISGGANVTLDQLDLLQQTPGQTAVSCQSNPGVLTRLTIRRSWIAGSSQPGDPMPGNAGVRIGNCQFTLLQSHVGIKDKAAGQKGHGSGISIADLDGRTYRLEGNIIAGNMGPALQMDTMVAQAAVVFRFNTVADNGRRPGLFGGIACPRFNQSIPIESSIVVGNQMKDMSQFADQCQFDKVVAGTMQKPAQGLITEDPQLDSRYHLTRQNPRHKARPMPGALDRDIDNEPRPPGADWDIGADEKR
jgi:hypothetical protein